MQILDENLKNNSNEKYSCWQLTDIEVLKITKAEIKINIDIK